MDTGRNRWTMLAVVGAVVLAIVLGTLGWTLLTGARQPADAGLPRALVPAGDRPTGTGGPGATTPAVTTPTPKATPSRTKPAPKPTPTRKPPRASLPPPPAPPAPSPSGTPCAAVTIGPGASRGEVKAALTTAANRAYWDGVPADDYPPGLEGPMPHITVPVDLMKAVAWQESGWQSTITACDGGLGVMQITPSAPGQIGTDKQMNNRFHTGYDVRALAGNAALGAEYLEWLTMYFGLYYFGSFDLAATAPVGRDGATMLLRDVVIAAYNVGPGSVERSDQVSLAIPNPRYVQNVTALITECECLSF